MFLVFRHVEEISNGPPGVELKTPGHVPVYFWGPLGPSRHHMEASGSQAMVKRACPTVGHVFLTRFWLQGAPWAPIVISLLGRHGDPRAQTTDRTHTHKPDSRTCVFHHSRGSGELGATPSLWRPLEPKPGSSTNYRLAELCFCPHFRCAAVSAVCARPKWQARADASVQQRSVRRSELCFG